MALALALAMALAMAMAMALALALALAHYKGALMHERSLCSPRVSGGVCQIPFATHILFKEMQ